VLDPQMEACYEAGWTDGLPVVPPTPARVEAMLGARIDEADEPIAWLAPGFGAATLRKIAANAVMAGCLAAYLPVVEAAVLAVADPAFHLENCVTTVHSQCPLLLVNGPIAEQLEMNGGAGALASGNRANATIGRALSLCIRNIGRAVPGGLDATTIGHPGKYSYCFTETPASPWPHFQTDRGFPSDASTVTVYAADAPLCICDYGRTAPEQVMLTIAESVAIPGSYNAFFRKDLWLVMAPEHAEIVAAGGWSKDDVRGFIYEHARLPAATLCERGLYGFADSVVRPEWLDDAGAADMISVVDAPQRVNIAVAGAPYGGYTAAIMGSGTSVTRAVEP
jgi:hypothetical protein